MPRKVVIVNPQTVRAPQTRRRFGGAFGELAYLCEKIHYWLHVRRMKSYAKRYLPRLECVLGELPSNSHKAIVRAEGNALRCELTGELKRAMRWRKREIELTELLHEEAAKNDPRTRAWALHGRDAACLKERRAMLENLAKRST